MADQSKPSILEQGIAQVQESLRALPDGKTVAAVALLRPDGEIDFGLAFRINDEWKAGVELRKKLREKPSVSAVVEWSR